jgi:hypothetical protein
MDPVMALPSGADVVSASRDYLFATWQSAFLVVWRHETTADAVADMGPLVRSFGSHHGAIALVVVVEATASLPAGGVREQLAASLQSAARFIRVSAVVHEASGFRAAAVRSVLAGLTLIVRPPYAHKIFAGLDHAAAWVAEHQRALDPAALAATLRALRSAGPR